MMEGTVAVVGASGLVGSTFVERLMTDEGARIVPFIHSSGNAARLGRHGLELRMVDIMSPASIGSALQGCTHVVNCSRGGKDVLTRGFQNLLDASIAAGIERFVHISSVAVYGDTPPGEIVESREPRPELGTYGASKLHQDRAVEAAVKHGLPAVVVCPPNISGPYSPFLLDIVNTLRAGQFALVDNGALPCELLDVENLVHAMRLALGPTVTADGSRLFVTDCSGTTWRDVIDALAPLAEAEPARRLDRGEAARLTAPSPQPRPSLGGAVRHLLSSDVREALRQDPLIARAEELGKWVASATPGRMQKSLRRHAAGAPRRRGSSGSASFSPTLVRQQLRGVRYSCARARDVLDYKPIVSFDRSMNAFGKWYREAFGFDTEWSPLLKQLYS